MTISFSKISALTQFKMKELLKNKTFLISALMAPGLILLYRFGFSDMMSGNPEEKNALLAMTLRTGIIFTTVMISLMMPATFLAKDKEKNTLRTLMTSSVTGIDYFISSILPVLGITILMNIGILFISGVSISDVNLPVYLIVTTLCALAASILGMIVGIFSKNQMAASNNAIGFMMILMMVPMLSTTIGALSTINDFLFTGIAANMVNGFVFGDSNPLKLLDWGILLGSCLLLFAAFLSIYKRNGFEKD